MTEGGREGLSRGLILHPCLHPHDGHKPHSPQPHQYHLLSLGCHPARVSTHRLGFPPGAVEQTHYCGQRSGQHSIFFPVGSAAFLWWWKGICNIDSLLANYNCLTAR